MPSCHSPEPKEYALLLQRKVEKAAMDWIPLVRLCVLVSGNIFKLRSLVGRIQQ